MSVFLAVVVGGDGNGDVQYLYNSPIAVKRPSDENHDTVVKGIGGMGNEDNKLDNAKIRW